MNIATNFNTWADNTKKKVTSTSGNAKSSIGDWLDKTYNNAKTADMIKTPSTYITGNTLATRNTGYNPARDRYETINPVYNPSTDRSKTTTLKAYQQNKDKTTAVENIQKSLNTLGYKYGNEGELKVDGDFGIKTETNWNKFIKDRGSRNFLSGIGQKIGNAYDDAKEWLDENGEDLKKSINFHLGIATKNPFLAAKGVDGGMGLAARNTDKTYTVGLQGDASALINGVGSIGYAVDQNGNRGIVVTKGGGSGTDIWGYSGGMYGSVSNAKELQHLDSDDDLGVYGGISVNMPIAGVGAGYEYSGGMYNGDDEYDPYMVNNNSLSISKGRSLSPVNIHGGVSTTDVYEFDQDKNLIQNIYNILKNNN